MSLTGRCIIRKLSRHFQLHPRRFYGDRGATRRDYSDPGYQKLGYISESSFSATHRARFKKRHSGEIPAPSRTLSSSDVKSAITKGDYLHRSRSLGDARRRYEQQKQAAGEESVLDSPAFCSLDEIDERREDEELPVKRFEPLPFRPLFKKKGKTHPLSRKRGFKGLTQDLTKYRFPWSRLDEFTKTIAVAKRRAKRG